MYRMIETAETFKGNVPNDLKKIMHRDETGTWTDLFGEEASEIFMEYRYAKATAFIAKAGKKKYNLLMITNAWQEKFPWRPGGYPSGGPIVRYRRIWKT